MTKATSAAGGARGRIQLEREFDAPIEDVWELWTTAEGIESWWGPDGFSVKVRTLDLRVGGQLHYAMIATAKETVAFMKREGMPTTTECQLRYTEVVPKVRLAYVHLADFIPGVAAYDVGTVIELQPTAAGARMVMTFDAMHDEEWTERAVQGWQNELGRLEAALSARSARGGSR